MKYDYKKAKIRWHEICESSDYYMPIYHKDWYWDAASDDEDDWKVIVYEDENAIAGFPFKHFKKLGLWRIENEWAVSRCGIWIHFKNELTLRKKNHLNRIITQYMIDNLPYFDHLQIKLMPEFDDVIAFIWNGFDCKVAYNQYIKNKKSEDIYSNISRSRRNIINKAKNNIEVKESEANIDEITDFFFSNYPLCDKKLFSKKQFIKLIDVLIRKNKIKVLSAYDNDDLKAMSVFILDEKTIYNQFLSRTIESYCETSIILYEAIIYAMENDLKYDSEGSVIKNIFELNDSFSCEVEPIYIVIKKNIKYQLFDMIKKIIKGKD